MQAHLYFEACCGGSDGRGGGSPILPTAHIASCAIWRGAGFGFFNLASIVFGGMAPLLVFGISQATGDLRIALLVCSPPIFAGALVLLRARDHLDEDAARIFQAIVTAMQEQQARDASETPSP